MADRRLLAIPASPAGPVTLSLYSLATARQLRLVLAAATVFFVVVRTYGDAARVRRLLATVTLVGLMVAGFAAYQDATRATMIYGLVEVAHPNSGPFANHSHFSQFVNSSVGAALALIGLTVGQWQNERMRPAEMWAAARQREHADLWAAAALCVLGPAVVFLSMSRMGMLSMLAAGALTAALVGGLVRRGDRWRGTGGRGGGAFAVVALAVAAVAVVLAVGFDRVFDRLATLGHAKDASMAVRWQIVRDIGLVWRQFPLVGTGLGTHEFVFPAFSRQDSASLFTHAENEYAQLLEETGIVGVALAAAFVAAVVVAFVRAVRSPSKRRQYAAAGLGFGLVAVLIHSASDFGQHVLANATLTAVSAAILTRLGGRDPAVDGRKRAVPPKWAVPAGFGAVLVGGLAWAVVASDTDRRADAFARSAETHAYWNDLGYTDDDTYRGRIAAAAEAARLRPTDVTDQSRLAIARWQLVARDATDPATQTIELSAEGIGFVRRLVADLRAARTLCPTYGPPLALEGQLRSQVLGEPAGDEQILLAYRLTPYDRETARLAGMLAVKAHDWPAAGRALSRYRALGGPTWRVVDAYLLGNRPDLAQEVAAGDREQLLRLAGGLDHWPGQADRAAAIRAEAERLLVAQSSKGDADPADYADRARLAAGKGDAMTAAMWYEKALNSDYGRVDWRLALARSQMEAGLKDDALRNVRICLRLRPDSAEALDLLNRLTGRASDRPQ